MTAHEDLAAFVLDALGANEAAAFERHLAGCGACSAEVEPLRLAAAALAFAGPSAVPPARLRARVLNVPAVVVAPLARRRAALALVAVAAVCAAVAAGLRPWTRGDSSVAGLHAYAVHGARGALLAGGDGEAVLLVRGLAAPATGTVYQLWVIRAGTALPAGFLRGRIGVLRRPVERGETVAVSLEPRGGSPRPTGPLLLEAETA
jgi:anti-sigma-K factor RskA